MDKKVCTKCNLEKSIDEFNHKNKKNGTFQSSCKECDKIIRKESYQKNKKTTYERNKRNSENNLKLFLELKSSLECSMCGENHIACLDFHHTDPNKKEFSIGNVAGKTTSFKRLKEEIDKCIVLCSNCHRKLHHNENKFESR